MRRAIVIAMATALFLSVTAGIAGAAPWEEKATGGMVAEGTYPGLTVDIAAFKEVQTGEFPSYRGQGQYYYQGRAYHVDAIGACIDTSAETVTIYGPAKIQSGVFGTLTVGDEAYGFLSLRDNGDGTVSARAGIKATAPEILGKIAEQCGGPASFPAMGPGGLNVMAKQSISGQ